MSKPPTPKVTNAAGKSAELPLSAGKANAYAVSAGDVITIDNTERGRGKSRQFLLKRKGDDLVITWSDGEVATFENFYKKGLTETNEGLRGQTLVLEHKDGIAAVVVSCHRSPRFLHEEVGGLPCVRDHNQCIGTSGASTPPGQLARCSAAEFKDTCK